MPAPAGIPPAFRKSAAEDTLPDGYTLDEPPATLPAGYTLDEPQHDLGGDVSRAVLSGAESGVYDLAGTPGDVATLGLTGVNWLRKKAAKAGLVDEPVNLGYETVAPYTSGALKEDYGDLAPFDINYKPQTRAGRIAQTATEWGTAAALPLPGLGGVKALRYMVPASVVGGTAAGAAGEAGVGKLGQAALGIAATLAAGIRPALLKNAGKLVRDATTGVTEGEWAAAQRTEDLGHQVGVPVSGGETVPGVASLASDVANSPQGGPAARRFFTERPAKIRAAVDRAAAPLGGAPGASVRDVGQASQKAAEGAIGKLVKERTAASSPSFKAMEGNFAAGVPNETIPMSATRPILGEILQQSMTATGSSRSQLEQLAKQITAAKNDAAKLNAIRLEWRERVDMPTIAANSAKTASAHVTPIINEIQRALETHSGNFRTGMAEHIRMSPPVDEALASHLKPLSENPEFTPMVLALLNPDKNHFRDILYTGAHLSRNTPGVVKQMARTYIGRMIDKAMQPTGAAGAGERTTGGKIFQMVVGGSEGSAKRKNLQAFVTAAAQDAGVAVDGVWNGFQNLLRVLDHTATIPGAGSPTFGRMSRGARASESRAAGAAQVISTNPTKSLGDWWRGVVSRRAYGDLAKALFETPESVEALRRLAQMRPTHPKAALAVAEALSLSRESSGHPRAIEFPDGSVLPWEGWLKLGKPDVRALQTAPAVPQ